MKITRIFAQPSRHTFTIPPISKLVARYVSAGVGWIDPCAGWHSPAEITNDLNSECPTTYHLNAIDFCKSLNGNEYAGVLFDPPYSLRQMKEIYNSIGIEKIAYGDTTRFYANVKDVLAPLIITGGYAICCGWNSIGFGKRRGFKILEILLVCHGRAHNDTIVVVERKLQGYLTHLSIMEENDGYNTD